MRRNIDTPFAAEPVVTAFAAALRTKARALKRHALTVYFAARDPRTPLPVRVLAVCIAAYAFSPIDLIPDFIPVLGYLDDLVLIPLGVALVVKLVPLDSDAVGAGARRQKRSNGRRRASRRRASSRYGSRVSFVFVRWALHARAADELAIGLAQHRDLAAVRALIVAGSHAALGRAIVHSMNPDLEAFERTYRVRR